MSKTYKQFINEVRVGYDVGIPKFHQKSNDELINTHKPIYSGKLDSGHEVTVAKHKDTGVKSVFIHHNGKHIGTIETHHEKHGMSGAAPDAKNDNIIHVAKSNIHKSHQGKGIMTNVYKHLVHNNHTVRSDGMLTHSAHKMWTNLANDKNISVKKVWHGDTANKSKNHHPSKDVPGSADGLSSDQYIATKKR